MDYTDEQLLEAILMDELIEAQDGCMVEPDGVCPHGYQSPALLRGLV